MVLQYPNSIMSDVAIHVSSLISGIVTPIFAFQLALKQPHGFDAAIDSTTGLLGAISFFSLLPLIAKQAKDLLCKTDAEKIEGNPHHTHNYFISLAASALITGVAYAQKGLIEPEIAIGIGVVSSMVASALALRWKMDRDAEWKSNSSMSAI